MTRDETMKLLQECGFGTLMDHPIMTENMMRFAALVAEQEREACAVVCERLPEAFKIAADEFGYKAETPTAENYAAAIRARSEE